MASNIPGNLAEFVERNRKRWIGRLLFFLVVYDQPPFDVWDKLLDAHEITRNEEERECMSQMIFWLYDLISVVGYTSGMRFTEPAASGVLVDAVFSLASAAPLYTNARVTSAVERRHMRAVRERYLLVLHQRRQDRAVRQDQSAPGERGVARPRVATRLGE